MSKHENSRGIPLPPGGPQRVKSVMLYVISLAQYAKGAASAGHLAATRSVGGLKPV